MVPEDDTPRGASPQETLRRVALGFRAMLDHAVACGAEDIPRGAPSPRAGAREASPAASSSLPRSAVGDPPPRAANTAPPTGSAADPAAALEALRAEIGDCRRCKLCEGRTQIVFGVGDPRARVLFVGEGPGEEEDRRGEPFVGRAGQLLTDIITKGMGLARSDVYIANVVKCRPPGNRNPEPDEIAACEPFLRRQIEAISPEVIVALGKFAAQTLAAVDTPITRLRGRWQELRGIRLMPTFHPSYLLRNPAAKREVWEDIRSVMAAIGLPLPPGSRGRS
jgi:uracil-DNA glycosylase